MHLKSGKRLRGSINCKIVAQITILSRVRPRETLPVALKAPKFSRFLAFY